MDVLLAYLLVYYSCIFCKVSSAAHHSVVRSPGKPLSSPHDNDDDDKEHLIDVIKECVYINFDHDQLTTNIMYCANGCCGTMDDQKCCQDTDDDKKRGNRLVTTLIVVAAILCIVSFSCCVFGIYKHKMAKRRKTRPDHRNAPTTGAHNRTASYSVFFIPGRTEKQTCQNQPQIYSSVTPSAPIDSPNPTASPARYESCSPPPPYTA